MLSLDHKLRKELGWSPRWQSKSDSSANLHHKLSLTPGPLLFPKCEMKPKWNSNSPPSNQTPVFDQSSQPQPTSDTFHTCRLARSPPLHFTEPTWRHVLTFPPSFNQTKPISGLQSQIFLNLCSFGFFFFGEFFASDSVSFLVRLVFVGRFPALDRRSVSGVWCFLLQISRFSFLNFLFR